jgi:hypothetical protein
MAPRPVDIGCRSCDYKIPEHEADDTALYCQNLECVELYNPVNPVLDVNHMQMRVSDDLCVQEATVS